MHERPTFRQPLTEEPWVGVLGERGPAASDHQLSRLNMQYDQAPERVLAFLSDPQVIAVEPDATLTGPRTGTNERALTAEDHAIVDLIRGALAAVTEPTRNGPHILLSFDAATREAHYHDAEYMQQLQTLKEMRANCSRIALVRRSLALASLRVYFGQRSAWHAQQPPAEPLDEPKRHVA